MKNNGFTSVLLGVLAFCALASLLLCWSYFSYTRQVRKMQGSIAFIKYREAAVNQLIADVVDYSRKTKDNKEIVQILETVGLKAVPAGTATGTPAAASGALPQAK